MIKKEKSILIILLVLVVSFITAGFSFWIIVATPKSMVTSKYSVAYDSLPDVAYIWRSDAEFARYKTVEEALSKAQKNDTVYIIPGTNPTVNSNCEVKSGVTLALPCNENKEILSKTANNVNQSHGEDKVAYLNPTKYRYCNMNISWGVTLINNGTISIGGFMSGGGGGYPLAAFTAGNYGQITMDRNSVLQNNGVIECYGYIDEKSRDNGSQVINNSGSSIKSPFTVYEHRGGSAFAKLCSYGMADLKSAPFNRFYMGNVIAKVSIKNGAQLLGYANLYAGDKHNETNIKIAGNGNSNLINVKSGSELRAKYNPDTQVTKLQLYGNAELNSMALSISVDIIGEVLLETKKVLFPIAWYYNVELKRNLNGNKANVIFNQDVKLLPGGSLIVDEGVTLTVGKMAIYDANFTTDTTKNTGTMPYVNGNVANIPAGELIVNGALNCSEFGGVVQSSVVGAKLSVGTAKISVQEVNTDTYISAWNYNLSIKTGANATANTASFYMTNNSSYTQNGNTYYYWYDASNAEFNITYSHVYDNVSDTSGTITNTNATKFKYSASFELTTPTHTNTNLNFMGWFTDPSCAEEYLIQNFDGAMFVGGDVTLYGLWTEEKPYTISFVTNSDITIQDMPRLPKDMATFDPLTNSTINNAITKYDNDVTKTQYFGGWYLDSNLATTYEVGRITEENIDSYVVDGKITLYAKWIDKIEVKVVISRKDGDHDDKTTYEAKCQVVIARTENDEPYFDSTNKTVTKAETWTYYVIDGHYITITSTGDNNSTATPYTNEKITNNNKEFAITAYYDNDDNCVTAGTLITLADGTQKAVEDLVESDVLLVYDHETGEYVESGIIFIERDGWKNYDIINLEFSDGTKTRLIYEHGLFDLTLNKYVYITEQNYREFVGHEFAMISGSGYERVTLTSAYMTNEYTGCYSLVTVYHMNYFIDGLFSMPGGIDGLFNYFEYDEDLKYDVEKMLADIEKYGLYTYEDFAEYIPYEVYEYMFPAKYFKVAVEKGMITWEEILALIERYLAGHEII